MKKIFALLILFSIVILFYPAMAFADHNEALVSIPQGTSAPGCEDSNECFVPDRVSIDVGGIVTWSNDDSAAHTVTAGSAAKGPSGVFDSSLLLVGNTFSHQFVLAGEFPYFCMVHPWMAGKITVHEEGEEPLSEKIKELGEASGENVKEAAEGAGQVLQEGGAKVGQTVEKAGEILGETTEKVEKVSAEVGEGASEVGQEVSESSKEISEEVMEAGGEIKDAGGCLIATATFGSELAPEVQQLRELRDNTILKTESGLAFMNAFNQFYYTFSPTIADLERENPTFKEVVKVTLTPLISSLSILNNVEINSEHEMLGYGISLILLNIGMYAGIPMFGIIFYKTISKNKNKV